MIKLDHLTIPVSDLARSQSWYVTTLGLTVEFEVPERHVVAVQDSDDFTIFLQAAAEPVRPGGCALYFRVADVERTFVDWTAQGIAFSHGPCKVYWGYGAELADPDGYLVRLWDERSMKEH